MGTGMYVWQLGLNHIGYALSSGIFTIFVWLRHNSGGRAF